MDEQGPNSTRKRSGSRNREPGMDTVTLSEQPGITLGKPKPIMGNKKGFYRYIGDRRKTGETGGPLQRDSIRECMTRSNGFKPKEGGLN